MRRCMVGCGVVLLACMLLVRPASADRLWCKSDPVVTLDGAVVEFSIAIPSEYVPLVNGPVVYDVKTPKGVQRQLIVTDLGYNGYGVEVRFSDGNGIVEDGTFRTAIRVAIPVEASQLEPDAVVPTELTVLVNDLTMLSTTGTSEHTSAEFTVEAALNTTADTVLVGN